MDEEKRRKGKKGVDVVGGQEVGGSAAKSELVVCLAGWLAEVGAPILRPNDAPPRQRGLISEPLLLAIHIARWNAPPVNKHTRACVHFFFVVCLFQHSADFSH